MTYEFFLIFCMTLSVVYAGEILLIDWNLLESMPTNCASCENHAVQFHLTMITDVESADDIILPMEPCTVDFGDGTTSVLELRSPMGNSALDWDAMRSSYVGVIHWYSTLATYTITITGCAAPALFSIDITTSLSGRAEYALSDVTSWLDLPPNGNPGFAAVDPIQVVAGEVSKISYKFPYLSSTQLEFYVLSPFSTSSGHFECLGGICELRAALQLQYSDANRRGFVCVLFADLESSFSHLTQPGVGEFQGLLLQSGSSIRDYLTSDSVCVPIEVQEPSLDAGPPGDWMSTQRSDRNWNVAHTRSETECSVAFQHGEKPLSTWKQESTASITSSLEPSVIFTWERYSSTKTSSIEVYGSLLLQGSIARTTSSGHPLCLSNPQFYFASSYIAQQIQHEAERSIDGSFGTPLVSNLPSSGPVPPFGRIDIVHPIIGPYGFRVESKYSFPMSLSDDTSIRFISGLKFATKQDRYNTNPSKLIPRSFLSSYFRSRQYLEFDSARRAAAKSATYSEWEKYLGRPKTSGSLEGLILLIEGSEFEEDLPFFSRSPNFQRTKISLALCDLVSGCEEVLLDSVASRTDIESSSTHEIYLRSSRGVPVSFVFEVVPVASAALGTEYEAGLFVDDDFLASWRLETSSVWKFLPTETTWVSQEVAVAPVAFRDAWPPLLEFPFLADDLKSSLLQQALKLESFSVFLPRKAFGPQSVFPLWVDESFSGELLDNQLVHYPAEAVFSVTDKPNVVFHMVPFVPSWGTVETASTPSSVDSPSFTIRPIHAESISCSLLQQLLSYNVVMNLHEDGKLKSNCVTKPGGPLFPTVLPVQAITFDLQSSRTIYSNIMSDLTFTMGSEMFAISKPSGRFLCPQQIRFQHRVLLSMSHAEYTTWKDDGVSVEIAYNLANPPSEYDVYEPLAGYFYFFAMGSVDEGRIQRASYANEDNGTPLDRYADVLEVPLLFRAHHEFTCNSGNVVTMSLRMAKGAILVWHERSPYEAGSLSPILQEPMKLFTTSAGEDSWATIKLFPPPKPPAILDDTTIFATFLWEQSPPPSYSLYIPDSNGVALPCGEKGEEIHLSGSTLSFLPGLGSTVCQEIGSCSGWIGVPAGRMASLAIVLRDSDLDPVAPLPSHISHLEFQYFTIDDDGVSSNAPAPPSAAVNVALLFNVDTMTCPIPVVLLQVSFEQAGDYGVQILWQGQFLSQFATDALFQVSVSPSPPHPSSSFLTIPNPCTVRDYPPYPPETEGHGVFFGHGIVGTTLSLVIHLYDAFGNPSLYNSANHTFGISFLPLAPCDAIIIHGMTPTATIDVKPTNGNVAVVDVYTPCAGWHDLQLSLEDPDSPGQWIPLPLSVIYDDAQDPSDCVGWEAQPGGMTVGLFFYAGPVDPQFSNFVVDQAIDHNGVPSRFVDVGATIDFELTFRDVGANELDSIAKTLVNKVSSSSLGKSDIPNVPIAFTSFLEPNLFANPITVANRQFTRFALDPQDSIIPEEDILTHKVIWKSDSEVPTSGSFTVYSYGYDSELSGVNRNKPIPIADSVSVHVAPGCPILSKTKFSLDYFPEVPNNWEDGEAYVVRIQFFDAYSNPLLDGRVCSDFTIKLRDVNLPDSNWVEGGTLVPSNKCAATIDIDDMNVSSCACETSIVSRTMEIDFYFESATYSGGCTYDELLPILDSRVRIFGVSAVILDAEPSSLSLHPASSHSLKNFHTGTTLFHLRGNNTPLKAGLSSSLIIAQLVDSLDTTVPGTFSETPYLGAGIYLAIYGCDLDVANVNISYQNCKGGQAFNLNIALALSQPIEGEWSNTFDLALGQFVPVKWQYKKFDDAFTLNGSPPSLLLPLPSISSIGLHATATVECADGSVSYGIVNVHPILGTVSMNWTPIELLHVTKCIAYFTPTETVHVTDWVLYRANNPIFSNVQPDANGYIQIPSRTATKEFYLYPERKNGYVSASKSVALFSGLDMEEPRTYSHLQMLLYLVNADNLPYLHAFYTYHGATIEALIYRMSGTTQLPFNCPGGVKIFFSPLAMATPETIDMRSGIDGWYEGIVPSNCLTMTSEYRVSAKVTIPPSTVVTVGTIASYQFRPGPPASMVRLPAGTISMGLANTTFVSIRIRDASLTSYLPPLSKINQDGHLYISVRVPSAALVCEPVTCDSSTNANAQGTCITLSATFLLSCASVYINALPKKAIQVAVELKSSASGPILSTLTVPFEIIDDREDNYLVSFLHARARDAPAHVKQIITNAYDHYLDSFLTATSFQPMLTLKHAYIHTPTIPSILELTADLDLLMELYGHYSDASYPINNGFNLVKNCTTSSIMLLTRRLRTGRASDFGGVKTMIVPSTIGCDSTLKMAEAHIDFKNDLALKGYYWVLSHGLPYVGQHPAYTHIEIVEAIGYPHASPLDPIPKHIVLTPFILHTQFSVGDLSFHGYWGEKTLPTGEVVLAGHVSANYAKTVNRNRAELRPAISNLIGDNGRGDCNDSPFGCPAAMARIVVCLINLETDVENTELLPTTVVCEKYMCEMQIKLNGFLKGSRGTIAIGTWVQFSDKDGVYTMDNTELQQKMCKITRGLSTLGERNDFAASCTQVHTPYPSMPISSGGIVGSNYSTSEAKDIDIADYGQTFEIYETGAYTYKLPSAHFMQYDAFLETELTNYSDHAGSLSAPQSGIKKVFSFSIAADTSELGYPITTADTTFSLISPSNKKLWTWMRSMHGPDAKYLAAPDAFHADLSRVPLGKDLFHEIHVLPFDKWHQVSEPVPKATTLLPVVEQGTTNTFQRKDYYNLQFTAYLDVSIGRSGVSINENFLPFRVEVESTAYLPINSADAVNWACSGTLHGRAILEAYIVTPSGTKILLDMHPDGSSHIKFSIPLGTTIPLWELTYNPNNSYELWKFEVFHSERGPLRAITTHPRNSIIVWADAPYFRMLPPTSAPIIPVITAPNKLSASLLSDPYPAPHFGQLANGLYRTGFFVDFIDSKARPAAGIREASDGVGVTVLSSTLRNTVCAYVDDDRVLPDTFLLSNLPHRLFYSLHGTGVLGASVDISLYSYSGTWSMPEDCPLNPNPSDTPVAQLTVGVLTPVSTDYKISEIWVAETAIVIGVPSKVKVSLRVADAFGDYVLQCLTACPAPVDMGLYVLPETEDEEILDSFLEQPTNVIFEATVDGYRITFTPHHLYERTMCITYLNKIEACAKVASKLGSIDIDKTVFRIVGDFGPYASENLKLQVRFKDHLGFAYVKPIPASLSMGDYNVLSGGTFFAILDGGYPLPLTPYDIICGDRYFPFYDFNTAMAAANLEGFIVDSNNPGRYTADFVARCSGVYSIYASYTIGIEDSSKIITQVIYPDVEPGTGSELHVPEILFEGVCYDIIFDGVDNFGNRMFQVPTRHNSNEVLQFYLVFSVQSSIPYSLLTGNGRLNRVSMYNDESAASGVVYVGGGMLRSRLCTISDKLLLGARFLFGVWTVESELQDSNFIFNNYFQGVKGTAIEVISFQPGSPKHVSIVEQQVGVPLATFRSPINSGPTDVTFTLKLQNEVEEIRSVQYLSYLNAQSPFWGYATNAHIGAVKVPIVFANTFTFSGNAYYSSATVSMFAFQNIPGEIHLHIFAFDGAVKFVETPYILIKKPFANATGTEFSSGTQVFHMVDINDCNTVTYRDKFGVISIETADGIPADLEFILTTSDGLTDKYNFLDLFMGLYSNLWKLYTPWVAPAHTVTKWECYDPKWPRYGTYVCFNLPSAPGPYFPLAAVKTSGFHLMDAMASEIGAYYLSRYHDFRYSCVYTVGNCYIENYAACDSNASSRVKRHNLGSHCPVPSVPLIIRQLQPLSFDIQLRINGYKYPFHYFQGKYVVRFCSNSNFPSPDVQGSDTCIAWRILPCSHRDRSTMMHTCTFYPDPSDMVTVPSLGPVTFQVGIRDTSYDQTGCVSCQEHVVIFSFATLVFPGDIDPNDYTNLTMDFEYLGANCAPGQTMHWTGQPCSPVPVEPAITLNTANGAAAVVNVPTDTWLTVSMTYFDLHGQKIDTEDLCEYVSEYLNHNEALVSKYTFFRPYTSRLNHQTFFAWHVDVDGKETSLPVLIGQDLDMLSDGGYSSRPAQTRYYLWKCSTGADKNKLIFGVLPRARGKPGKVYFSVGSEKSTRTNALTMVQFSPALPLAQHPKQFATYSGVATIQPYCNLENIVVLSKQKYEFGFTSSNPLSGTEVHFLTTSKLKTFAPCVPYVSSGTGLPISTMQTDPTVNAQFLPAKVSLIHQLSCNGVCSGSTIESEEYSGAMLYGHFVGTKPHSLALSDLTPISPDPSDELMRVRVSWSSGIIVTALAYDPDSPGTAPEPYTPCFPYVVGNAECDWTTVLPTVKYLPHFWIFPETNPYPVVNSIDAMIAWPSAITSTPDYNQLDLVTLLHWNDILVSTIVQESQNGGISISNVPATYRDRQSLLLMTFQHNSEDLYLHDPNSTVTCFILEQPISAFDSTAFVSGDTYTDSCGDVRYHGRGAYFLFLSPQPAKEYVIVVRYEDNSGLFDIAFPHRVQNEPYLQQSYENDALQAPGYTSVTVIKLMDPGTNCMISAVCTFVFEITNPTLQYFAENSLISTLRATISHGGVSSDSEYIEVKDILLLPTNGAPPFDISKRYLEFTFTPAKRGPYQVTIYADSVSLYMESVAYDGISFENATMVVNVESTSTILNPGGTYVDPQLLEILYPGALLSSSNTPLVSELYLLLDETSFGPGQVSNEIGDLYLVAVGPGETLLSYASVQAHNCGRNHSDDDTRSTFSDTWRSVCILQSQITIPEHAASPLHGYFQDYPALTHLPWLPSVAIDPSETGVYPYPISIGVIHSSLIDTVNDVLLLGGISAADFHVSSVRSAVTLPALSDIDFTTIDKTEGSIWVWPAPSSYLEETIALFSAVKDAEVQEKELEYSAFVSDLGIPASNPASNPVDVDPNDYHVRPPLTEYTPAIVYQEAFQPFVIKSVNSFPSFVYPCEVALGTESVLLTDITFLEFMTGTSIQPSQVQLGSSVIMMVKFCSGRNNGSALTATELSYATEMASAVHFLWEYNSHDGASPEPGPFSFTNTGSDYSVHYNKIDEALLISTVFMDQTAGLEQEFFAVYSWKPVLAGHFDGTVFVDAHSYSVPMDLHRSLTVTPLGSLSSMPVTSSPCLFRDTVFSTPDQLASSDYVVDAKKAIYCTTILDPSASATAPSLCIPQENVAFGVLCPRVAPFLCPDGSCATAFASCPIPADTLCPPHLPVACGNGACAENTGQCLKSMLSSPPNLPNKNIQFNELYAPACPIDAPFLCAPSPFWTTPNCVSSAQECDSIHANHIGYTVLHFAYSMGVYTLNSIHDALTTLQAEQNHILNTVQSLEVDLSSNPDFAVVCPIGTSMCPLIDLVSPVTCAAPTDRTRCTTPMTCSAGRTLCGDGLCYTSTVEHLLDAAIDVLQDPSITGTDAAEFLSSFAKRSTCSPYATLMNAIPHTRPIHCPLTTPFKCEDLSCVATAEECISGVLDAFSSTYIDLVVNMHAEIPPTLISGRRLGSTPQWDTFLSDSSQALANVRDQVLAIVECPNGQFRSAMGHCVVSSAELLHVASTAMAQITCIRQYAVPFWILLFSPDTFPTFDPIAQEMWCPMEETCTTDISACLALEVCTPSKPWHCTLYGHCAENRLDCAIPPSPSSTPTPSTTSTQSTSSTPSPTSTETASNTSSPTSTESASNTPSPTSTESTSSTPTPTSTESASTTTTETTSGTPTSTESASGTASPTSTETASTTPTLTGTPSPTSTESISSTSSPTSTVSASTTESSSKTPTPSASSSIIPLGVIEEGKEKSWTDDNSKFLILLILLIVTILLLSMVAIRSRRRKKRIDIMHKLDADGKPIQPIHRKGGDKLQPIMKQNPLMQKKGTSINPVKLLGINPMDDKFSHSDARGGLPSARSRATAMSMALSGRSPDLEAHGSLTSARGYFTPKGTPRSPARSHRNSTTTANAFFPVSAGTQAKGGSSGPNSPGTPKSGRGPDESKLRSSIRMAILAAQEDPNNMSSAARAAMLSGSMKESFQATKSGTRNGHDRRSPKHNSGVNAFLTEIDPSQLLRSMSTMSPLSMGHSHPSPARSHSSIQGFRNSLAAQSTSLDRVFQRDQVSMGQYSFNDSVNTSLGSSVNVSIDDPHQVVHLDQSSSAKSSNPKLFSHRRSMRVSQSPQKLDRSRGKDGFNSSFGTANLSSLLSYAATNPSHSTSSRGASATTVPRNQTHHTTTKRTRGSAAPITTTETSEVKYFTPMPQEPQISTPTWSEISSISLNPNASVYSDLNLSQDSSYWLPASNSSLPESTDTRSSHTGSGKRRIFQTFVSPLSDVSASSSLNTSLESNISFGADSLNDDSVIFQNPYYHAPNAPPLNLERR